MRIFAILETQSTSSGGSVVRRFGRWVFGVALAAVLIAPAAGKARAASENRCSQFNFAERYVEGTGDLDVEGFSVRAIRDNVPVYAEPGGDGPEVTHLSFGQRVRLNRVDDDGAWGSVLTPATSAQLGWVRADDLLCKMQPLIDRNTGLERKAIIRTATALRSEGLGVQAYRDPTDAACNRCVTLSRYDPHFIFDETEDRYLISRIYNLELPTATFTGWVSKDEVIVWNTAAGLRPREGLIYRDPEAGPDADPEEGRVCAYTSVRDAREQPVERCQPILGGERWYRSPLRLPVIGVEGDFYNVVVVGAGYERGTFASDPDAPYAVRSADLTAADDFRRIDVFFVVDGTESMDHVINAIKGTASRPGIVETIRTALGEHLSQGVSFRYGFRIYRDSVPAGHGRAAVSGIGEGLPLQGDACERPTPDSLEANHEAFEARFGAVRASKVPNLPGTVEDYAENTLGGLDQALIDVTGCSNNMKVIFVIGDHGYNGERHRARGFPVVTTDRIVNALTDGRFGLPPLLYFIQIPRDLTDKTPRMIRDYNKAYALFRDQALDILRGQEQRLNSRRDTDEVRTYDLESNFIRLSEANLTEEVLTRVTDTVRDWTNPDMVNELVLDLRGGASLVEAIERLRAGDSNIPILYWDMVEDRLCGGLGRQCLERVYEGVEEAYITNTRDVVRELWLSADQLEAWMSLLSAVQAHNWEPGQLRVLLVRTLVSSLESILHTRYSDVGETFEEFARRAGGLPVGFDSPVMKYSPLELMDADRIKTCEIEKVVQWLQASYKILGIAREKYFRPDYTIEYYPPHLCELTDKGRAVPYVPGRIERLRLGETNDYSYAKVFQDERVIYWLPQEFMP